MLAPKLKRFLIALTLAVSIIFYHYVFLIVPFEQHQGRGMVAETKGVLKNKNKVAQKKVVAFSLMKKLEIDGKEYDCRGRNSTERIRTNSVNSNNDDTSDETTKSVVSNSEDEHWMKIRGTQVFVYSVHYDRRLDPYHYLRIIAMVKGGSEWRPLYCQIECSDGQLHTTKITKTPIVAWTTTGNHSAADHVHYHDPVLLSCRVPLHRAPITLRISTQPCQRHPQKFPINLNDESTDPAFNAATYNKNFTICVKPLDFPYDISTKLLQWITVNKILGASKFDVYVHKKNNAASSNTIKLADEGVVNFRSHSDIIENDGNDVNFEKRIWQKRRYELLIYNDCLYRNIHASRFVVPVDIDEIIVPRLVENWHRLLLSRRLDDGDFASFSVRNVYFFKNDKKRNSNNSVLREVEKVDFFEYNIRSGISPRGHSGKSFVSTKNALLVSNHRALETLKPGVGLVKHLDLSEVQMNHYRDGCDEVLLPECKRYISSRGAKVVDNIIARFKSRFYDEYFKVIRSL